MRPPCLDDDDPDNPVRAIDAFVQTLDWRALGFDHSEGRSGSAPSFAPAVLLKLYIDGYQSKRRRSRALEQATRSHIEVIWLCQGAKPSDKTIADVRQNNLTALQNVNRALVQVCRELALIGGRRVAVDGTFLKACANRSTVHTTGNLTRELVHHFFI